MIYTTTRMGFALLLAAAAAFPARAWAPPDNEAHRHWSTSWIAPTQPTWGSDFALPLGMPQQLRNATLRQQLRLSVGGERMRLVISNEYGAVPLTVASAHVAIEAGEEGRYALFQGTKEVTVAPGATAMSDPLTMPAPDGARVQVDIHLANTSQLAGFHWDAREEIWLFPGDATGRLTPAGGEKLSARAFLSAVLVESRREPVTVVALGDSITDGNGSTPGADQRWPDHLARRLAPYGVAVLNAGISGNRLLRPGMGDSALARFDRDVLRHPGVRAVIVLLGTNDIGWPGAAFAPHEPLPQASDITNGLRQLIERAHLRGVRAIGATLLPFEDALKGTPLEGHHSARKESLRQQVNDWIRHAGAFDAVVDFDKRLRDEARPSRLNPAFDSGDHLHPGDAGYRAMAESIDLRELLGSGRP